MGTGTPGLARQVVAAAHGMRPLRWNVDTRDFERPGAERVVETAKARLRSGPTVPPHDGGATGRRAWRRWKGYCPGSGPTASRSTAPGSPGGDARRPGARVSG
ncbi:hypothetical protein ACFWIQ_06100 [Kitasatospora sp. NPDC127059]|uniref:hypothetical protein n=1 Tax=unclassified Kitasatospora TaxID=2633591 RepID=UPI0036657905